ncbi:MAG: OsmC family peroxiredoxin [Candidatus Heimdallarchaeota archaeon]|nr:OsmC family peroxiredoxin [Candidatus Heimdallarchaeota archaeon]
MIFLEEKASKDEKKVTEKNHAYSVKVVLIEDRVGDLILEDKQKPIIQVATPPEFPGGKEGIHSPEDLFVAAVASCKMTTFCAMAEKLDLELLHLRIDATGYLGKGEERGLAFKKIDVHMSIGIDSEQSEKSAEKCVDLTRKYCLITNSVKCPVNLEYEISS